MRLRASASLRFNFLSSILLATRKVYELFPVLLLCAVLSGCRVGPEYERPPVEIPERYYYEPKTAQDSLNLEWWEQFDDPVLTELIDEALQNNLDVKIAAANIEDAIGILIQTRAPLFPQIGYSATYLRLRNSTTLTPAAATALLPNAPGLAIKNPQTAWEAILTGSWEIDIWGRISSLVDAARANVESSIQARRQIVLSLVASVANTYIQLRGLDEQLAISKRTMETYGKAVQYFEYQHQYGQASQMEVASAKTQYETAAAKIPQVEAQIVQTENALNVLLARIPGPIPRGKSIYTLQLPMIPADLPSSLLYQRPDIIEAEDNLIAANANIGAAQALYFPSISLTGTYGGASMDLHNLFSGPSSTWSFMGSFTGPIFTAGAIYGQVVQTIAKAEAAALIYKNTIIQAFSQVEDALNNHEMLIEQVEAEVKLVAAAGQYVDLATLQYKGGYSPYFVVIQAQEQFFPAQLAWAQAKAQLFTSVVDIYQAMGGGWINLADSKTLEPESPNCALHLPQL